MTEILALKAQLTKIAVLFFTMLIVSCNTLKKVGENDVLLTKNTIEADGKVVKDETVTNLIIQKPNSTVLGYPLRLNLYNLANDDPDARFQEWLSKKKNREARLTKILSKKQVNRLGESFLFKGFSNFLKNAGEPPSIIDSLKTIRTTELLQAYYGSKGYFNNDVTYSIVPIAKKQRAEVQYQVDLKAPYTIDSIGYNINSKALDSLYHNNSALSFIKKQSQFDLEAFSNERRRITEIYRNSGVYNFQESSINFDVDTTKTGKNHAMDVTLNIRNKPNPNDSTDAQQYQIYRFKQINVYPDYDFTRNKDSLSYVDFNDYRFYYYNKLKYKPYALADAIFFEKDSVYRDIDYIRTNRQLSNLNTFKYPNIDYQANPQDTTLTTNIFLTARPKYSLNTEFDVTHSNIQQLGTAFGVSVISRNIFGGAETLSLTARGALGLLSDQLTGNGLTSEIGGEINITFPRIWFPINTKKIIPPYMLPQTRLAIGTNFQKNIGLDRQSLNAQLAYSWSPSQFQKNNLELINVEYVRNTNPNNFFRVYGNTFRRLDEIADAYEELDVAQQFFETVDTSSSDAIQLIIPEGADGFIDSILAENTIALNNADFFAVRSIDERKDRLTENNLIVTSNYTYEKNNKQSLSDESYYQFRLRVEGAGNLLSVVADIIDFETVESTERIFGVPYSQYFKGDIDFIKHWDLSSDNVLAFRTFFGLAVPYGNSISIPFVRSYFAGGSNDNRAWNAYSLGPGKTNNINDFNEANLKIAMNLEYRFPIVGNFKGALFVDAGNIWNVYDNEDNTDAIFTGFKSLADTAIGTGFGLRYDFSYFVLRLDLGLKTYNPSLAPDNRWFTDFKLDESVFNIGINYPF